MSIGGDYGCVDIQGLEIWWRVEMPESPKASFLYGSGFTNNQWLLHSHGGILVQHASQRKIYLAEGLISHVSSKAKQHINCVQFLKKHNNNEFTLSWEK